MMGKINTMVVKVLIFFAASGLNKANGQNEYSFSALSQKDEKQSSTQLVQANNMLNKQESSIRFTENKGQVVDQNDVPRMDVLFMSNTSSEQYIITSKGTSHQLSHSDKESGEIANSAVMEKDGGKTGSSTFYRVDMEWVNANPNPVAEKFDVMPGYMNYDNVPGNENGVLEVKDYAKVLLKGIYKGVDVRFYGSGSYIEYDYLIAPGADYSQIRIKISGTQAILNAERMLELNTPLGKITESAPKVFQEGRELISAWKHTGESEWGFDIQGYNPQLAMVIDPVSRAWGTYYGGVIEDGGFACDVDTAGNIYLAGRSWSTNNIATAGSHQSTISSSYDAFLVKFNTNGARQWGTYYGGNANDFGKSCVLDVSGNVYLAGVTQSVTNMSTLGSHQNTNGSMEDAFLVKFNSSGVRQWGTYYGGSSSDVGNSCSVDSNGNIYLAGITQSPNNIATPGSHRDAANLATSAFLVKFNSNGVRQWGTYYGGELSYFGAHAQNNGNSCAVDDNGDVYLAGSTNAISDVASTGAHQTVNNSTSGSTEAFVVKFNSNGVRQWGTYYGGASTDVCYSCNTDGDGNVFLTGQTASTTDIATNGAHQFSFGYTFLVKFNASGVRQWGTYYGDSGGKGLSCVADSSGNIYMAGETNSSTGIASTDGYQTIMGIGSAAFIAKFNGNGVRQWGTYYGGESNDNAYSCAIGDNGYVYIAGSTISTTNIASAGAHQTAFGSTNAGHEDAYIVKLLDCSQFNIITNISSNSPICNGGDLNLTSNVTGGTAPYTYAWADGFVFTSDEASPTMGGVPYFITGDFTLTVTDANGCQKTDTTPVSVVYNIVITVDSVISVCDGQNINLTSSATGGTGMYNYSWTSTNSFSSNQQNPVITNANLSYSGNYAVTITDTQGCYNSKQVYVTVNPNPTGTVTTTDNTKCSGACNGTAMVTASGGANPYTYLWSDGQTADMAYSLCQGDYSVVATDANGCNATSVTTSVTTSSVVSSEIYLTNLAAVDQISVSPSFSTYYTYNLPATINPNTSNPRNFVDPGKKARFKVECTNNKLNGQSVVSGICKVRSNNPYIVITDSSSALNNIGWNNNAWSADEFEIDIAPTTPSGTNAYIDFIVQENGLEYATTCIAVPITPLVYSPTTPATIDDDSNPDSQGNDNDICDPGEIIEFYPWLDNISTLNAEYVRGRFENLDNHSFINIWNGVPGVGTTVYDATWWNYSFAQPQTINASAANTKPEYDFVFDYNNTNTAPDFKLYMVMAGGFKLFSGTALSLAQWTLPFTFGGTGGTSIGSEVEIKEYLNVYPNPSNGQLKIEMKDLSPLVESSELHIYNAMGECIYSEKINSSKTEIDLSGKAQGIYFYHFKRDKHVLKTGKIVIVD